MLAVIAGLAFSAFTLPQEKSNTANGYYWYVVQGDQAIPEQLISETPISREDAIDMSPCPSGSGDDCLRGFSLPITENESSSGDVTPVKKP